MLPVSRWLATRAAGCSTTFYPSRIRMPLSEGFLHGSRYFVLSAVFLLPSGVRLLPNKFAMYLLHCNTGTTQQSFSSCIIRFRPRMFRLGRSWADLSGYTVHSNSKWVPWCLVLKAVCMWNHPVLLYLYKGQDFFVYKRKYVKFR